MDSSDVSSQQLRSRFVLAMKRCQFCGACCSYLYKSNSAGVQDYLCNRLYGLPEAGVEKYLSQLCQLVISRPFASLERVLVGLCAKSLRIAVKVHVSHIHLCHTGRNSINCLLSRLMSSCRVCTCDLLVCRYTGFFLPLRRTSQKTKQLASCGTTASELQWRGHG